MSTKKSSDFLKICIYTALIMLLEQIDYNDITITDIAKKAGVSRMSYYRTYSSKDDILIQYFDDLFQNCMNDFKQNPDLDPYHFYLRFFDTFQENKTLIHNLQNTNLYEMIMKSTVKPEASV